MNLFVYGTLQQGWGNNRLLGGASFLGKAITRKPYVLMSGGFPFALPTSPDDKGFPLLPVMGELYQVTEEHIQRCDSLEGHPSWYQRRIIKAVVDNQEVDTYIYEMPKLNRYDHYRLCNVSKEGYYYWAG